MKRNVRLLMVLVALGIFSSIAAYAENKVFLDLKDPAGDDTGNGKYVYPLDKSFEGGGMADILGFKMETDEKNIIFTMPFKKLVDPWNVGNRLTYIAIAIDNAAGGGADLEHNANAKLENPAEFVIYAGGNECKIRDMRGETPKTVKNIETFAFGDPKTNILTVKAPIETIGTPAAGWNITVAVGLQEDYGAGGLGDFREVLDQPKQWRGGGGLELAIDSNVYDIIAPEGADQVKILSGYSLEEGKLVTLPSVKLP